MDRAARHPAGSRAEHYPPEHYPPEHYPDVLLDHYLALARRSPAGTLTACALRTRSQAARRLLTRAACRSASLEGLLAAAGGEPVPGVSARQVDPDRLADLAATVALQRILPGDAATALALYELAVRLHGYRRVPPHHQGIHARLACELGRRDRAAELLDRYDRVDPLVAACVALDLANPFAGGEGEAAAWLERFAALLPAPGPELADEPSAVPFDRLAAPAVPALRSEVKISVLMTCHRPGRELITAVRSLIGQSWRNLEILVVDDGSPPRHRGTLERCAALDARVRVVELPANRGTFRARNAAFELAQGSIVAEMDSDDWSHPLRLEHQVRPLLADPSLVVTVPELMPIGEDLTLTRLDHGLGLIGINSLMYRKDPVLRRLGHYDSVRKAAGFEFLERMRATFGAAAVHRPGGRPSVLMRHEPGSLSHAEFLPGWKHPARTAYKSAQRPWHRRIAEGTASPYLPESPRRRRFAAPRHLLRAPGDETRERCDLVVAGDWRLRGGSLGAVLEELAARRRRGLKVAILHLESWHHPTPRDHPLGRRVQEMLNAGELDQALLGDPLDVELLVVRHPEVLQFRAHEPGALRARRVLVLAGGPAAGCETDGPCYLPRACRAAARETFGVEPEWCPATTISGALDSLPGSPARAAGSAAGADRPRPLAVAGGGPR